VGLRKALDGADAPRTGRKARKAREALAVSPADQPLFDALRGWRTGEARRQHVPPYVIFPDRSLIEMAALKPGSLARLADISGVGESKLTRYGEAVLAVIKGMEG